MGTRTKVTYNGISDFDKLSDKLLESFREPINEIGEDLYKKIIQESPENKYIPKVNSFHPKPLKQSISWTRAELDKKTGKFTIVYNFPLYVKNILDGVQFSDGIYHTAKRGKFMVFSQKAFPRGDQNPAYFRNGRYFFRRVRYRVGKNDFVDRAIKSLEKSNSLDKLGIKISTIIQISETTRPRPDHV